MGYVQVVRDPAPYALVRGAVRCPTRLMRRIFGVHTTSSILNIPWVGFRGRASRTAWSPRFPVSWPKSGFSWLGRLQNRGPTPVLALRARTRSRSPGPRTAPRFASKSFFEMTDILLRVSKIFLTFTKSNDENCYPKPSATVGSRPCSDNPRLTRTHA